MAAEPRLGIYVGTAKDVSCPGDHLTYEVALLPGRLASLECIPEMSFFKGGSPPWQAEGVWEPDGDDVVVLTITKQDATGPRKDTDISVSWGPDDTVVLRGTTLRWTQPPPEKDPMDAQRAQLAQQAAQAEAELSRLRSEREELGKQEEAHMAQQAELARLREELEKQKEESALRAKALEEQRSAIDEQRRKAEAEREAVEAERLAAERQRAELEAERLAAERQRAEVEAQRSEVERRRSQADEQVQAQLEEMRIRQLEVERQREEVEQQRLEEERLRNATEDLLTQRERELLQRAKRMDVTEKALIEERRQIHHSRAQLAVVQSHCLSMIGGSKADDHDAIIQNARLDQSDELEAADGEVPATETPSNRGVDVYEADWSAVQGAGVKENVNPAEWS